MNRRVDRAPGYVDLVDYILADTSPIKLAAPVLLHSTPVDHRLDNQPDVVLLIFT